MSFPTITADELHAASDAIQELQGEEEMGFAEEAVAEFLSTSNFIGDPEFQPDNISIAYGIFIGVQLMQARAGAA